MSPKTLLSAFSLMIATALVSASFPSAAQALNFRPPDRGAPRSTAGGATRSFCIVGQKPLTILAPNTSLGLTTKARPTFYVYVPRTKAKVAKFVLKDVRGNNLYLGNVPLPENAGVLSIQMPDSAPALEVGKDYRWLFFLDCRPGDQLEGMFVSAWVQRVQPTGLLANIDRLPLRERARLYAESGIWHDTLDALMGIQQSNPNDTVVRNDWNELLRSVGLTQLANEPVIARSMQPSMAQ